MEIEQVGKLVLHQQILQYPIQQNSKQELCWIQYCKTKTTVSKTELKCFNSVENKIIPHIETNKSTFTRMNANAQRKTKRKEKGIINVGWDIPEY